MVTFILLAALLIVAGAGAVAIPLIRRSTQGLPPAPWAALGATAVLVIGSAVLYATLSKWSWQAVPADSPRTMVASLARRLDHNPGDLPGWLMLGRSYMQLEEYPLAARAYERADRISGGQNIEALVGQAEALTLDDQSQLQGRAGRLLEQALKLDPNSFPALFFGAAAARDRGDLTLARERFQKLLTMSPPQNLRTLLEQQIAAIDQQRAGGRAPAAVASAHPPGTSVAGDAEGVPAVRVNVQLSPGMKPDSASAPLFVFVSDPAQPGPPLAVKKLESRFPQTVELTTRDSIMGRAFAAGQKVQVVARISRSGNPLAVSGDPFGEVAYQVGHDGLVNIIINQVTP
jgi:cytochrome c-type biogenesis protein CcmH